MINTDYRQFFLPSFSHHAASFLGVTEFKKANKGCAYLWDYHAEMCKYHKSVLSFLDGFPSASITMIGVIFCPLTCTFNNPSTEMRNILCQREAEMLLRGYVISRMDFCRSLLTAQWKKPSADQKCCSKSSGTIHEDHISLTLASIYWLPIKPRINRRCYSVLFYAPQ